MTREMKDFENAATAFQDLDWLCDVTDSDDHLITLANSLKNRSEFNRNSVKMALRGERLPHFRIEALVSDLQALVLLAGARASFLRANLAAMRCVRHAQMNNPRLERRESELSDKVTSAEELAAEIEEIGRPFQLALLVVDDSDDYEEEDDDDEGKVFSICEVLPSMN